MFHHIRRLTFLIKGREQNVQETGKRAFFLFLWHANDDTSSSPQPPDRCAEPRSVDLPRLDIHLLMKRKMRPMMVDTIIIITITSSQMYLRKRAMGALLDTGEDKWKGTKTLPLKSRFTTRAHLSRCFSVYRAVDRKEDHSPLPLLQRWLRSYFSS